VAASRRLAATAALSFNKVFFMSFSPWARDIARLHLQERNARIGSSSRIAQFAGVPNTCRKCLAFLFTPHAHYGNP
jgi:hypothetical protein